VVFGSKDHLILQKLLQHTFSTILVLALGIVAAMLPAYGQEDEHTFRRALPGYVYRFPADHAAHPEFRTEWWYYTGHLTSSEGNQFGFQLTFFRHALRPPAPKLQSRWALHTLYFIHFAITDEKRETYRFQEKVSRGALNMAGADPETYHVWVQDWEVRLQEKIHKHQGYIKWNSLI